jgi:squalene-associated FAD-dependent desaturase
VIAVIGGGWAGCAAAVELARRGFRVELHEASATPGGRARTVVRDGLPLDNGEHLLVGAYTATLALAARLHEGARESPWIIAPLAIRPFSTAQRNRLALRARKLPAPLGLGVGLLGAASLSWRERVAALRWFARQRRARFRCDEPMTVSELLADLPHRVRDELWAPLCVAALNTPPQRASAQVFLNVLREAFGGGSRAALTVVPRRGLGAAIPERAMQWLAARHHAVHLSSTVRILSADDRVCMASATGEVSADAVVVAVGPHQLAVAFDAAFARANRSVGDALGAVTRFAWEPITTVYLGYPVPVDVPRGLVRLDDAPGQWLFDRGDILLRAASPPAPALQALLSVVVSAHRDDDRVDAAARTAAIDAQLRRLDRRMPAPCWSQVITERRATYACEPALARPACGRLADRVYLAGDYTYAAFPATLEAAVRSGVAAAQAVAEDLAP